MDISANNFRDKAIAQVTVGYDWVNSDNYITVNVVNTDNSINCYRINGLTKYDIYDDFECMAISQCKLIQTPDSVYLSLDPHNESNTIEESDNFCFWGKSIEMVPIQC